VAPVGDAVSQEPPGDRVQVPGRLVGLTGITSLVDNQARWPLHFRLAQHLEQGIGVGQRRWLRSGNDDGGAGSPQHVHREGADTRVRISDHKIVLQVGRHHRLQ
jgi:hypothetical protein